jgi:hypothetical protein
LRLDAEKTMPITPQWANPEKTIIYLIYEKPWKPDEFVAAVRQTNALLDTVDYPVDMIIQMRDGLPSVIDSWPFRTVMRNFHPNIRNTALVGASDTIRRIITAFMRVMGQDHPFFFAATLEEAHHRLAERQKARTTELNKP